MGNILPHPILSRIITRDKHHGMYTLVGCELQGYRLNMEDAICYKKRLSDTYPNTSIVALFDGHSGNETANYLKDNLIKSIESLDGDIHDPKILKEMILLMDQNICNSPTLRNSGSTLLCAIIRRFELDQTDDEVVTLNKQANSKAKNLTPPFIYKQDHKNKKNEVDLSSIPVTNEFTRYEITILNVGDSNGFIIVNNAEQIIPMSIDHKPNIKEEFTRIIKAGGIVQSNRVDGNLAMSRSIGDYMYKNAYDLSQLDQKVIALADCSQIYL